MKQKRVNVTNYNNCMNTRNVTVSIASQLQSVIYTFEQPARRTIDRSLPSNANTGSPSIDEHLYDLSSRAQNGRPTRWST